MGACPTAIFCCCCTFGHSLDLRNLTEPIPIIADQVNNEVYEVSGVMFRKPIKPIEETISPEALKILASHRSAKCPESGDATMIPKANGDSIMPATSPLCK